MIARVNQKSNGAGIAKLNNSVSGVFFLPAIFLMTFLLVSIGVQNASAAENAVDTSCVECHSDMVQENISKVYVHAPFMHYQCSVCHIENGLTTERQASGSPGKKTTVSEKNISWIDYSVSPAQENWFFIPAEMISQNSLVVSARNTTGGNYKETLELPAIETLPVKATNNEAPVIETIEVGVYRGVLISAEIGWITDKMADSEVIYGTDNLRYSVKEDRLATEHKIVLQGLKADTTYKYLVASKDIFGNSSVSDSGTFSTADPSPMDPAKYEEPSKIEIRIVAGLFRNENSYLVRFTANQPVILKVGSVAAKSFPADATAVSIINASYTIPTASSPNHMPMRNLDNISEICRKCHAKMFEPGNHVVDRGPSPGMIIPASYSTNSAGHITCVTCHNPHASDFEYITVKSRKLELCVGCHKGYDVAPDKRRQAAPLMLMVKK